MKWTEKQAAELTAMCMAGTSNADIAAHFDAPITEIHAKRSALGITIPKIKVMQGAAPLIVKPEFAEAVNRMEALNTEGLETFINAGSLCIVLARQGDTALIVSPFNHCAPFVVPLQHRRGETSWWQGHYLANFESALAYYREAIKC